MSHRYFVETPVTSQLATLHGAEAHHLQHVMRARPGDEITIFDGSGREFRARVAQLKRAEAEVSIIGADQIDREADRQVTVGVTMPKGDRQRWLIEKLTELGAARIVPLRSARSSVHPSSSGLEKLRRYVIEASKQCGRNQLLQVDPPIGLLEFLEAAPTDSLRWLADPLGAPPDLTETGSAPAYLAVGPEGGFTAQERQAAADRGWLALSLGPRILRIETACAVLTTLVTYSSPAS